MNKKDESVIPKGYYCHGKLVPKDGGGFDTPNLCPYWSCDPNKPEQENGYCSFLEKSDSDLNAEANARGGVIYKRKKDGTMERIEYRPNEVPFPFDKTSLLWDQCKECGINMEDDEEELIEVEDMDLPTIIFDSTDLKDMDDVFDKEWDELLDGVDDEEDEENEWENEGGQ